MLGLQNEREWATFCEKILEQPGLAADPHYNSNIKRNQRRAEITALIDKIFLKLTTQQVVEKLDGIMQAFRQ